MPPSDAVQYGRIRLLSDATAYRNSFTRFVGDQLNGWIEAKRGLNGSEGRVTRLFGDRTFTLQLDDGRCFDFPFESVEEQIMTVHKPMPAKVWKVGKGL